MVAALLLVILAIYGEFIWSGKWKLCARHAGKGKVEDFSIEIINGDLARTSTADYNQQFAAATSASSTESETATGKAETHVRPPQPRIVITPLKSLVLKCF